MPQSDRPAWVTAEYERIGKERERASREADRIYWLDLLGTCAQMIGWTVLGLIVAAVGFHVHGREFGMIFLYAGMIVNWGGVLWTIVAAYHRGEARGDW